MAKKKQIEIVNKKANFNYFFIDEYVAGIVLMGCEIKPIRNLDAHMSDAYCAFENNELYIKNMHISACKNADFSYTGYTPKRDRKLLLTKRELRKLHQSVKEKGLTIVPVKMFINEHGLVKVVIALSKGKKNYDKSQTIKERDLDREMKSIC